MKIRVSILTLLVGAITALYSHDTQEFVSVGDLVNTRTEISSASLKNGQVLIAGGRRFENGRSSTVADVEIFTPSRGTSRAAENGMTTARTRHTMTTLSDGKVLVTGGWSVYTGGPKPAQPVLHNSAELFDPNTESWETVGSLNKLGGTNNAAVLLQDGKVLVVGETDAEIYDPTTKEFSYVGHTQTPRINTHLTLLQDGEVLVTGTSRVDDIEQNQPAELFVPSKNRFVQAAVPVVLRTARYTTTVLEDGRVLLVGGDAETSKGGTAEIYDPARDQFTFVGFMHTDREGHTATLLADGRVAIAGGYGIINRIPEGAVSFVGPIFDALQSVEFFDPRHLTFTEAGTMKEARASHGAVLTRKGNLMVFGGETLNTCQKSIEVLFIK